MYHGKFGGNCSQVTEFILKGFTDDPKFKTVLFVLFLVIYIVTVLGNLGIFTLIRIDVRLHTPMYFFLSNLSIVDLCYSTVVTPKMLVDLLADKKAIPYAACATQILFFTLFIVVECFLLAAMAYDRYVAICNPLLYQAVMQPRHCVNLVAGSFLAGCINSMAQATGMLKLSFCGSNIIDLFFCDISPVLSLSTSDTTINHIVLITVAYLSGVVSSLIVIISYVFILITILRIHSAEGKRKAFSTCASHLTAVSIFFGTGLFIYLQPSTNYSRNQDKVASVFYTVVTPMLNPLIYSLRNKEVKDALRRVMKKRNSFTTDKQLCRKQ